MVFIDIFRFALFVSFFNLIFKSFQHTLDFEILLNIIFNILPNLCFLQQYQQPLDVQQFFNISEYFRVGIYFFVIKNNITCIHIHVLSLN